MITPMMEGGAGVVGGGGGGADTVLVYLRKDLTTILKLCTRKQGDLKEMCLTSLKDFTECADAEALMGTGGDSTSPIVVRAVEALIKACETRNVQMVTPAIDGLHKLMAFGFIHGRTTTLRGTKTSLIGAVLEAVSQCIGIHDATVHLQILKACLTAATTPSCELHRGPLMCAVKTCYNIYLVSTTPLNSTTAKGNLRQIINYVFGKFETEMALKPTKTSSSSINTDVDKDDKHDKHDKDNKNDKDDKDSIISDNIDCDDENGGSGSGASELHDDYEVSFVDCFLIFRALCKLSSRKLSHAQELASLSTSSGADRGQAGLSAPSLTAPTSSAASVNEQALESKVLALELLFEIVESSGPALRTNALFIEKAIKRFLCSIIVQNGVSTNPSVLKYTLSIFHSLMRNFKSALKTEIGVFFSNIFLRVLESPNSTLQQKWLILQLLHHICEDPQTLAEMYINYDCDLRSNNVFCRMVEDICKVAQSHSPDAWVTPEQDLTLKTLALDCLVRVMKSLVDWTEEGKEQLRAYQLQLEKHEIGDLCTESEVGVVEPADFNSDEKDDDGNEGVRQQQQQQQQQKQKQKQQKQHDDDLDDEEVEVEFIALQKQKKTMLESIRGRWALDTKRAIAYMQKVGVIDDTAESLAKFLCETEGLDKRATGEFIGGSKPFNKDVLKAYVALFNFAGMELDEALRFFLGQFLLPGEGQVVDRIMENFGQRYYLDNAESKRFEDADAVYKLSFAIIMLATDIHNPKVKNKLTFEQWEKMVNKDLAMGLDVEYLQNVFKRIAAKKLELVDDGGSGSSGASSGGIGDSMLGPQQRQEQFTAETTAWIATSLRKLESDGNSGGNGSNSSNAKEPGEYHTARRIEYVRPIFESIWASAVVALSILLEGSEDAKVIELCLLGFRYGIHVAAAFYMETERSTFITALDKFTLLSNLREMRPKNIRAIRELVALAQAEGNYLRGSWFNVLRSVSLLERLHLTRSGLGPDSVNVVVSPKAGESGNGDTDSDNNDDDDDTWEIIGPEVSPQYNQQQYQKRMMTTPVKSPKAFGAGSVAASSPSKVVVVVPQEPFTDQVSQIELLNSLAVGGLDVDVAFMDRIFADSALLSDNAVVDFVRALCDVSLSEVSSATPRIFSLQKIVEVAYYNMNNRTRFVWARIWVILREHFVRCGCHPLSIVSIYAVDSLRQLAMKYLEKAELASYNFQQEFLRPFETVITTTTSPDVADFVINAVRQIVTARTANIASGWKTILAVLASCAHQSMRRPVSPPPRGTTTTIKASDLDAIIDGEDDGDGTNSDRSNSIAGTAYNLLAEILEKYPKYLIPKFVPEVAAALVEFGKETSNPSTSLCSVTALRICADKLWEVAPLKPLVRSQSPSTLTRSQSPSSTLTRSQSPSTTSTTSTTTTTTTEIVEMGTKESGEEETALSAWFPILTGFASIASHPNAEVRNAALESLFGVLEEEIGGALTPHMWALVLRGAVLPIFDNAGYSRGARAASAEALDQDWLDTSCSAALSALTALYVKYFGALGPTLLCEVFGVISAFLCQPHSVALAGYAADAFTKLLGACGPKFTRDMWDATYALIENFFASDTERSEKILSNAPSSPSFSQQSVSANSENSSNHSSRSNSMSSSLSSLPVIANISDSDEHGMGSEVSAGGVVVAGAATAAGLTKRTAVVVRDIVRTAIKAFESAILQNYDKIGVGSVVRLLDALSACHESACKVLDSGDVHKGGAAEASAAKAADVLGFYLRLGFRAYAGATQERDEQEVAGKVFPVCLAVLRRRVEVKSQQSLGECEVLLVLNSLLELNDNKYDVQYGTFYKMFVELVRDESEDIRDVVAKHFSRIGTKLKL